MNWRASNQGHTDKYSPVSALLLTNTYICAKFLVSINEIPSHVVSGV
jgi:hypothetical protein